MPGNNLLLSLAPAAVLLLALGVMWPSAQGGQCPHAHFESKHHCTGCRTAEDAAAWCAGRESNTRVNTVFAAVPAFSLVKASAGEEERCAGEPARAWKCRFEGVLWGCQPEHSTRGNDGTWACSSSHATSTGHLFYKEMVCGPKPKF
jgi:hypothetical protein